MGVEKWLRVSVAKNSHKRESDGWWIVPLSFCPKQLGRPVRRSTLKSSRGQCNSPRTMPISCSRGTPPPRQAASSHQAVYLTSPTCQLGTGYGTLWAADHFDGCIGLHVPISPKVTDHLDVASDRPSPRVSFYSLHPDKPVSCSNRYSPKRVIEATNGSAWIGWPGMSRRRHIELVIIYRALPHSIAHTHPTQLYSLVQSQTPSSRATPRSSIAHRTTVP